MKSLNLMIAGLTLLSAVPSFADMSCTGSKREMLPDQTFKTTEVPLAVTQGTGAYAIHEGSIDDRAFTVTPLQNDSYMVTITVAPDYTHGVISTLSFTSEGRFALATVDVTTVYKVSCVK